MSFLKNSFLLLCVILIQFTLLPYFQINHYLDLVFIATFFWAFKENINSLAGVVFIGALLIDGLNNNFFGVNAFIYLVFFFFLTKVLSYFKNARQKPLFFFVLLLGACFFFFSKACLLCLLQGNPLNYLLIARQITANFLLTSLLAFISHSFFSNYVFQKEKI